jgi:hypothetical protein
MKQEFDVSLFKPHVGLSKNTTQIMTHVAKNHKYAILLHHHLLERNDIVMAKRL